MNDPLAILLSGGLDSTVLLAQLLETSTPQDIYPTFVRYGAPHNSREYLAYQAIVVHFERRYPNIWWHPQEVLVPELDRSGDIFHGRNLLLIAMLNAIAMNNGAKHLFIATNRDDSTGFPDCSGSFLAATATALRVAYGTELHYPFSDLTKREIVEMGVLHEAPLHLTSTCYRGGMTACGTCSACKTRTGAFVAAGYKDPIDYDLGLVWPTTLKELVHV